MTPPQAHPLDEALRTALRDALPEATLAWLHGSAARDAWRLWARVLRDWQDLQPARRAALRALATELQEAAA
ncbi:hypothetical protein Tfont_00335 [Tepidimonas fonticaldi]|uniref:Uncharacterized protein n=1 Tax=Tepidimonas fonticaldi TaxID=1101373 RepID=A0A554XQG2_9BURK|nr:hypothetical protein [Tepidimonas fonticaldi]TSE38073.1 hypothetical protein Tfont_00335 [Tepidimonas fonticaldi]